MKKIALLFLSIGLTILSCKNDDELPKDDQTDLTYGTAILEFNNTINNEGVELSAITYSNTNNENYTISELKYIISNIVLIKSNGETFDYPVERSYFLINEDVIDSKKVNLADIPTGEYTKIKFGFGVDQSNYPLNGMANFIPTAEESNMLWSWSAGYIFFKFEGSYSSDNVTDAGYMIHIGSHGTNLDNYKEVTLTLPNTLSVTETSSPEVVINADIAKVFDGTNTHSLQSKNDIQMDPVNAPKIAENIAAMFSAASVSN